MERGMVVVSVVLALRRSNVIDDHIRLVAETGASAVQHQKRQTDYCTIATGNPEAEDTSLANKQSPGIRRVVIDFGMCPTKRRTWHRRPTMGDASSLDKCTPLVMPYPSSCLHRLR